jgi:hypothetical protein
MRLYCAHHHFQKPCDLLIAFAVDDVPKDIFLTRGQVFSVQSLRNALSHLAVQMQTPRVDIAHGRHQTFD